MAFGIGWASAKLSKLKQSRQTLGYSNYLDDPDLGAGLILNGCYIRFCTCGFKKLQKLIMGSNTLKLIKT